MKCPIDGELLVISDRNGIEIDYCPKCRGVWLDRGELDKIIERSDLQPQAQPEPRREYREERREPPRDDYRHPEPRRPEPRRYEDDDDGYYKKRKYKKRDSWLSELFDIID